MRWLCLLLAVGSVLGCEFQNDRFCEDSTECSEAPALFCDVNGVYQDVGKRCIEAPTGACDTDNECMANAAPICGDIERSNVSGQSFTVGECRACADGAPGDAECASKEGTTPICESGACVECRVSTDCTSDAAEPICDEASNSCVGCVENSDCPSEVCENSSGQCLDEASIIYVATTGADGAGCGTQASRCQTISGAQGGLAKVTATRKTLKLSSGTYPESVTVNGLEAVLIGPATVNPSADDEPGFDVVGAADVTLTGVTVTGATGGTDADGVACGGNSTVVLIQSTISQNDDTGLQGDGCSITVRQSTISQNDEGGIDLNAGSFALENNFVVSNGTGGAGGSQFGGLRIASSASGDVISFNTIANNQKDPGTIPNASGVICTAPLQATASSNVVSSNAGGAGQQLTATCDFVHSNIEGGAPGTGNIDMDPSFVNPPLQNFHIQFGSPCIDMAEPAATLSLDVDGDARPQGARHDIGADEFVQ